MEVAAKYQNRLKDIKEKVQESYQYFQKNADRYAQSMRFVFATSLTNEDCIKLQSLNKPTLEFNILEAIISKLRGDFAKQEPSISVRASDGVSTDMLTDDFLALLDFMESHMREAIVNPAANDGFQSDIFRDTLGGGYSVAEIYIDYVNDMSMDKKIFIKRVFDPTLTYFDPLARTSHKGDGAYCGQFFPMSKEEFEKEFGKGIADQMMFVRGDGFSWSYKSQTQDVAMVCYHYEKKKKKVKIVKLSNGHVVREKHYNDLLKEYERRGFIEQPPIIIETRYTFLESIIRFTLCENKILEVHETDYKYLPLVFFDGNSVEIKDETTKNSTQMTRGYCYHAYGIQRLKNYAGQTVGSEMENMIAHKFKVALESIPDKYLDSYKNVQQQSVLIYNAFDEKNPSIQLPPPMEIQRTPTPPIVENTFMGSDQVTQAILGSYDSQMITNQNDTSGVAFQQGAIQTAAASYNYVNNYMKGLNRVCTIYADLIPKYYVTPRSLPVMTSDGKRSYQIVNSRDEQINKPEMQSDGTDLQQMKGQPNQQDQAQSEQQNAKPKSINLRYQSHELNITIEAGVNTAVQKQLALDQMIRMVQVSPLFAEFMNAYGLEPILDNMDIRGIETLKASAQEFMKMKQEQAKQEAEQAQQGDPMIQVQQQLVEVEGMKAEAEMASVEQKAQASQSDFTLKVAGLALEKEKVDIQRMKVESDVGIGIGKLELDQERVDSENARTAIETAMNIVKSHHERKESGNVELG